MYIDTAESLFLCTILRKPLFKLFIKVSQALVTVIVGKHTKRQTIGCLVLENTSLAIPVVFAGSFRAAFKLVLVKSIHINIPP